VDPPGVNARIGSALVWYAHPAEPSDGPWETGSDVPLYAWLSNQRPGRPAGVGRVPGGRLRHHHRHDGEVNRTGVGLPPEKLVELEDRAHPMSRDVRQEIRGGDVVWVTLHVERAGSLSLRMPNRPPACDEEPLPPLPILTTRPEPPWDGRWRWSPGRCRQELSGRSVSGRARAASRDSRK